MKREKTRYRIIHLVAILLATALTVWACTWSLMTDHSVRFNNFRSGKDFYRLPPLPIMVDSKTDEDVSVKELENYYGEENPDSDGWQEPLPTGASVWRDARTAVEQDELASAQELLHQYLKQTAYPAIDDGEDRQRQRNSAFDMLDAMDALKNGARPASVRKYLDARYRYDNDSLQNVDDLTAGAADDKALRDNWDYLRAGFLIKQGKTTEALEAFSVHAARYPNSEKSEAVLYMLAKLTMEASHSFENNACDIDGTNVQSEPLNEDVEPTDKCRDENWQTALNAFRQLIQKYPRGRYLNNARGWCAYLYRRGGERAQALAEYYRLLGHPTSRAARLEAKKSLQILGHDYDDATLDEVERLIADDANAAMAYAYHRIYNHAVDLTTDEYDDWCCYKEETKWQDEQTEKKRVADAKNSGHHELNRVAQFANAMIKRHPQARVSGGFVLRVAEAQLELGNFGEALTLARKTLALGVDGELKTEALWIKGSSEHQRKELKAARATLSQLIRESPRSKLTEGARRLLAMTAEDQDDLETALEQYITLDYEYDVAYFVDVLLPTDRLAKFVNDHKNIPQYDHLLYALGVRYMRDGRWDDARGTLKRVQTENGESENSGYYSDDTSEANRKFAKDPDWEWERSHQIKTSWVMQDLKTIDVMEHLEQAVDVAPDDEAKAEAMYQLASFQFDADPLTFYNPAAWNGSRYSLLPSIGRNDGFRLPNETGTLLEYSESHDTLARAIPVYLGIVNRFPNTRAAKDALYSAAVAHERLSIAYPYWRDVYENGLFASPQMVTYSHVRSRYPRYHFPRGTTGWEASTRTVNGGPGWAPPPKPPPRLTRAEKAEALIKRLAGEGAAALEAKIDTTVKASNAFRRKIFDVLLITVSLLALGYGAFVAAFFWKTRGSVERNEISTLLGVGSDVDKVFSMIRSRWKGDS